MKQPFGEVTLVVAYRSEKSLSARKRKMVIVLSRAESTSVSHFYVRPSDDAQKRQGVGTYAFEALVIVEPPAHFVHDGRF